MYPAEIIQVIAKKRTWQSHEQRDCLGERYLGRDYRLGKGECRVAVCIAGIACIPYRRIG